MSRLGGMALTPAQRNEISKQAVDVHKQVLEELKTPSEIAKNMGVARAYESQAAFHDYQRSAQYVTDQIMIHAGGEFAKAHALAELDRLKTANEKLSAEELRGTKAPPILAKMTGMTDMGDIARYYGRNNLAHMLQIAEAQQARIQAAGMNKNNQEFTRMLTNYERLLGRVKDYDKLLKDGIPIEKWNAMTPSQQQTAKFNGGYPITEQMKNNAATARNMLDNVGKQLYGDSYIPEPMAPPIINVTPSGAAPGAPKPGTGTPVTQGWLGDLYNWMTKERVPQETIDKARQIQNPHGA